LLPDINRFDLMFILPVTQSTRPKHRSWKQIGEQRH